MDAYLEGHSGWRVPVNKTYIPYHVGVYGSTGSGKSWFTRYVLIPLYRRAGYGVLVLDWSGTDYAPYCENTVRITDIALDEESILSYLEDPQVC
jgi:DNA helicase HerA-like ATPase